MSIAFLEVEGHLRPAVVEDDVLKLIPLEMLSLPLKNKAILKILTP